MGTGNGQKSGQELLAFLYHEIRSLARRRLSHERPDHTLSTTALVHEVYLRMAGNRQRFTSEADFVAAASATMRRILVDHARAQHRLKRGSGQEILPLSELAFDLSGGRTADLVALDDALTQLTEVSPRQARVVEMRFFGGLSEAEIATQLGVSEKTIKRDWAAARAWLRVELAG